VVAPNRVPQLVFDASYGQLLLLLMPQFQLLLFDMIPSLADNLKQHF
jgi:hypothetical protein